MTAPLATCDSAARIDALRALLAPYGLRVRQHAGGPIPGSFWGGSEAGLMGACLYVRSDTPLHSALHEACHYICMDAARRSGLDTDAGGDYDEENAVCYLQILCADALPALGRERMFEDMDSWGYSFRLGSARAWFENDAEDARAWLFSHGITDDMDRPSGRLRDHAATLGPPNPTAAAPDPKPVRPRAR